VAAMSSSALTVAAAPVAAPSVVAGIAAQAQAEVALESGLSASLRTVCSGRLFHQACFWRSGAERVQRGRQRRQLWRRRCRDGCDSSSSRHRSSCSPQSDTTRAESLQI
jgi:hypothetical protein